MHRFAFSSLALSQRNESIGIWGLGLFCIALAAPLPEARAEPAKPSTSSSKRTWQTHVVKPGESLGLIASRYRVRLSHLVEWNNIENPDKIAVGRALRVFAPASVPRPSQGAKRPSSPSSSETKQEAVDSGAPSKKPARPKEQATPVDAGEAKDTAASNERAKALPSLSESGSWTGQSKPRPNHPGTTNLRLHTIPSRPRSFAQ